MARPYLGNPKYTIEVLQKYHFVFQKRFGQNFLIDEHVLEKIIDSSGITKDDFILEIGPGIGTLTRELCARYRKVVAVEIDSSLIPALKETTADLDNLVIINDDIMKTDLDRLISDEFAGMNVTVCANLPYYITTPIIMKLLESGIPFENITIMMQKEVAERLIAEPGTKNTGAITYGVQYRCTVDKICDADRNCFDPAPKVDSVVLRLNLRKEPPVTPASEKFFFRCIKAGFMMRRKTLLNSLTALNSLDSSDHFGKEGI